MALKVLIKKQTNKQMDSSFYNVVSSLPGNDVFSTISTVCLLMWINSVGGNALQATRVT